MNKKKITQLLLVAATVSVSSHIVAEETSAVQQTSDTTTEVSAKSVLEKKGQVVNVSTNLRIRQSANTNSEVIGYIVNGQQFEIKSKTGDWYNIDVNGKTGYVYKDYVKELGETLVTEPNNNNGQVTISNGKVVNISSSLNLRKSASTSSEIIGSLSNGQEFKIKSKTGDWYYIDASGKIGYVHKDYVKEIQETVVTPPANNNNNNEESKASKGQVINVSTNLRVRKSASTSSEIIGYLINNQTFNIKSKSGDWFNIEFNGVVGYIHKDYVKIIDKSTTTPDNPPVENVKEQVGVVINVSSNLRLRDKPTTDATSSIVAYLLPGDSFKIIGISGDWYNINYNGKVGYIFKDYVKKIDGSNQENNSKTYENILNILKAQLGAPYVYGGSGELLTTSFLNELKTRFPQAAQSGEYNLAQQYLDKGYRSFDCSGFLYWGFKQVGINIGRTTYDQINNGVEVSKENVRPGDFLFYGDISHVGMYIGNNQWIESSNSKSYVKIVDVPWSKIARIRRILN